MSISKKSIAALICLCFSALKFFNVSANITVTKSYNATDGFSVKQGKDNWNYEQWDGSTYSEIKNYDTNNQWWIGDDAYCIVSGNLMHPGNRLDSVRKFTLPGDGIIRIRGTLSLTAHEGNGTIASILYNNSLLWKDTVLPHQPAKEHLVCVSVKKGDFIYFVMNNNGDNFSDGTLWSPTIEYIVGDDIPLDTPMELKNADADEYRASVDFDRQQGRNGWSYLSGTNGIYTELVYNAEKEIWQGDDKGLFIGKNVIYPGADTDACRKWTARKEGKIRIIGGLQIQNLSGDGVIAYVSKNGETIWTKSIQPNILTPVETDIRTKVSEGDVIILGVNKNGNQAFDYVHWDPAIEYYAGFIQPMLTYGEDDYIKESYRLSDSSFMATGDNNWNFMQKKEGLYNELSFESNGTRWLAPDDPELVVCKEFVHPGLNSDAVCVFDVPRDGYIRISGCYVKQDELGDGVNAKIYRNDTLMWNSIRLNRSVRWDESEDSYDTEWQFYIRMYVKAGDKLYFEVNKRGSIYYDATIWDFSIDYILKPSLLDKTIEILSQSILLNGEQNYIYLNGKKQAFDYPYMLDGSIHITEQAAHLIGISFEQAIEVNGVAYAPLRFNAEQSGKKVNWNNNGTVWIFESGFDINTVDHSVYSEGLMLMEVQ